MPGIKTEISRFFKDEYSRMNNYVKQRIDDMASRDSEDIIQDVMLRVFEAAHVSAPVENLAAYIYSSLRNRIIDVLRKKEPDLSLDEPPWNGRNLLLIDMLEDISSNTERDFFISGVKEKLYKALDELDDDDRALIIMNDFEGRTFREISLESGIPMGTLLSRKKRAMEKIKLKLLNRSLFMEDINDTLS